MRNRRGIYSKMYIIRSMRVRWSAAALVLALALSSACRNPFGREYEYEEQLYLSVDGSARRDRRVARRARRVARPGDRPLAAARFDRERLRRWYETGGCHVVRIGQPWYRHGRRFVQVQLTTDDIRTLGQLRVTRLVALHAGIASAIESCSTASSWALRPAAIPGPINWNGSELVAFKLHLPSKITFHNVRRLADNATGEIERGNILTWEQRLADRRAGTPVEMQVRMERESILYRTLWLFGGSFLAAVLVLIAIIWWVRRKGRR